MTGKTVLLTGFNAFGTHELNSSQLVVNAIASSKIRPWLAVGVLRTEFVAAEEKLKSLLSIHRPAYCICLGLHERADCLVIERNAHNCDDPLIPDNAGYQPGPREIVPGGPEGYPSTLPIQTLATRLTEHGIPFRFSDSAGSFLCNHVFYVAADFVSPKERDLPQLNTRVGFIHLPPVQNKVGSGPGVPRKELISAIELCVDTCNEASFPTLLPPRHNP
jgi:pyroglutamyl-peptidase